MDWRDRQPCFDLFAAVRTSIRILRQPGGAREIPVAHVSADFFRLIGARPALGRIFTPDEDRPGSDSVALLEDGFWRREFGGSPSVLGQTIMLEDRHFTVIGVLPPDVHFPGFGTRDVWIPLAARANPAGGGFGNTRVIARLREGISRQAAQAAMDAVTQQLQRDRPTLHMRAAVIVPLREWLAGEVRGAFLMLSGAAAFPAADRLRQSGQSTARPRRSPAA